MGREVIYVEEFLAQDSEYATVGATAAKVGNKLGRFFGGKTFIPANMMDYNHYKDKNAFNKAAKKAAINNSHHRIGEKNEATKAAMKNNVLKHKYGGTAAGAIGGGALGAGVAHLATSKKRSKIDFLMAKGDNMSLKDRAELAQLKRSVNTTKIASGVGAALVGGAIGNKLGHAKARKKNYVLGRKFVSDKDKAVADYNRTIGK